MMLASVRRYCSDLVDRVGAGWNRFWYTPADPLPLCVLRIAAGIAALWLHVSLTTDLISLFSRDGLLATAEIEALRPEYTTWLCFLDYLQSPTGLWIGHIAAGIVLLLFTIGCFSRITSVLGLYVVLCYYHRAPMITAQAEVILAMLMCYISLGPSGRCLSVDAWLARRRRAADSSAAGAVFTSWGANVALRLLQVHVCLVYLAMVAAKLKSGGYGPVWWNGDALWYLIARPESRLVDLTFLSEYGFLINLWTHAVVAFEGAFGLLIWNRWCKPLLLLASLVVWSSLALVTGLVTFCALMALAGLAFVPGQVLRDWFRRSAISPTSAEKTAVSEAERRVSMPVRK